MKRSVKWTSLFLATSLAPLLGWACSTDVRDAFYGGVLDFITGTTTETLASLLLTTEALIGV